MKGRSKGNRLRLMKDVRNNGKRRQKRIRRRRRRRRNSEK